MRNDTVVLLASPARVSDPSRSFFGLVHDGCIEAAVSAGCEEYLSEFGHERLPDGPRRCSRT